MNKKIKGSMRQLYLTFLVFAAFFVITITSFSDVRTNMYFGVPSSILTPSSWVTIIVAFVLLLVTVAYWQLSKRIAKIKWTLFVTHLVLTIPIVVLIKFPSLPLNMIWTDENQMEGEFALVSNVIKATYFLFAVGQILFFIFFLKTGAVTPKR